MFLAGLPLATLLGIFAAVGAAVVGLYILKLRRRPVPVPFSRIWQQVLRDKEATTLFSQLKRILSLLLQLLLVALLVLALGDPRSSANLVEGRSIVVLVDASASMKATDVASSRMEAAKRQVRQLIAGLGGSDRMLLARMDAVVTPLSTMTAELAELELAADQLRATDTRAELAQGLRFAVDALRGLSKPEIVVISDGAFGEGLERARGVALGDVAVRFVPIGNGGSNLAITAFSARRYPLDKSRAEVMLEVTNTTSEPAEVELSLLGDGDVVDLTRLRLAPNERLARYYKDLAGASRTLEAAIKRVDGKPDDLPADDRAYALMPERRRARVLVVTSGNTYLEAALLLDEFLDVTTILPANYPSSERFDVTIFDGVAPRPAAGAGGLFYLNPPKDGSPVAHARALEWFGFDQWDKKSPLLRWTEMGDVQVSAGFSFKPQQQDKVVGASEFGPILVSGRREGHDFVALGFDPRNSDFVLRVAWPLFVLNTINDFVEEDTSYVSSFRTGEVWSVPAPSAVERGTLVAPGGAKQEIPVRSGRAVYLGDVAGIYRLEFPGIEPVLFAANLADPEESRIGPVKTLALGSKVASPVTSFAPGVRRELWIYLLAAVIVMSVIEWVTYHRRVTV